MATDPTGRRERADSRAGTSRVPDYRKLYKGRLDDVMAGDFLFSLTLLRPGRPSVALDGLVPSFSWADETSVLTGSVTVQRPDPERPSSLRLSTGQRIRCRVRWGSRWYALWTMRLSRPRVDPISGNIDVELADDMDLLRRNKRTWTQFRKTKRRKRGFTLREVAQAVAKVEGVRLGRVYAGKTRFFLGTMKKATATAVLRAAIKKVRDATAARLIMRMVDGALEILPFSRNDVLYQFGAKLEEVSLQEEQDDNPVTVIEAKGHVGKGRAAKKVRHTAYNRDVVRRFGRVVEEKNYGKVDSLAELKAKAERELARKTRVRRTGELTARGIPFVRRGQMCRWLNDEPGWHGRSETSLDRTFVFTTAVVHNVDGPDYRMTMSINQDDIFVRDAKRKARELRALADRRRKKAAA